MSKQTQPNKHLKLYYFETLKYILFYIFEHLQWINIGNQKLMITRTPSTTSQWNIILIIRHGPKSPMTSGWRRAIIVAWAAATTYQAQTYPTPALSPSLLSSEVGLNYSPYTDVSSDTYWAGNKHICIVWRESGLATDQSALRNVRFLFNIFIEMLHSFPYLNDFKNWWHLNDQNAETVDT